MSELKCKKINKYEKGNMVKLNPPVEISRYLIQDGTITLDTGFCLKSGEKIIRKLTKGFWVKKVIRYIDPNEILEIVKLVYTVYGGDTYVAVMPFNDFLNCRYHKYCKNIERYPRCSDNDFNKIFDYEIKCAFNTIEELSFDEIVELKASFGTHLKQD